MVATLVSARSAITERFAVLENIEETLEDVEGFLQAVDRHLEPYLKRAVKQVADTEHLKEGVAYQMQTGGKRIRAALCATACELFCGSYLRALSFAAAIEHLQNFTLVHDDIADGDSERRGKDALWKRFGIAHGINIGDIFVPLGAMAILDSTYSPAIKLRLMRIISEYGLEMAEGQSLDINLRQNDSPTTEEYMKCTSKKTGAFLAMATVGGAIIGEATKKDLDALRRYALLAGTSFQIKDDVLDLTGGKGRFIGSDILEGKRTLLMIYGLQHSTQADRKKLVRILNKPRASNLPAEVEWVCDFYRKTGAVEYAERVAQDMVQQASECLTPLPETKAKYRLLRISKYLSSRAH
jgi:geranylgeranyl diphosphate synthase, type I